MRIAASIILLGLASTAAIATKPTAPTAKATLSKADGASAGTARFTQRADGVWLQVEATGLAPGVHGIHLHTTGKCDAPDFASAGGHWNPTGKKHGLESPQGAHMGDIPNLTIGADGKGKLETKLAGVKFDSSMMGLFDSDGTALVVHAGPDDNHTDPSGNSGGRLACGVVTES